MKLFHALRCRSFAVLWSGQTISSVGDFVYQVALAWWVLRATGSAAAMGTVLVCTFVPMVLFLLVGGVAVDRFPRVPLMLGSDLLRALIVGVVAALALRGTLDVWHVCVASVLFGVVDAVFRPAYTALVPEITPAEALPSANALSSIGVQGGRILGPALGAAIVAAGGPALAFALDAASFLVSALLLLPLLGIATRHDPSGPVPGSILGDARAGIQSVLGSPWLWITIVAAAVTNVTLAGPYNVAIPFLVRDHHRADVRTLGLLYATFPIGYLLAGLWLGRASRIRYRGPLWYGAMAVAGLGMLALGLPIGIAGILVAALVNGAALELSSQVWTNTLQELVPNELLGRVSSVDLLGSYALLPVGFAVAGWATNAWGAASVCLLGGAATILIGMLGFAHPAIRRLD